MKMAKNMTTETLLLQAPPPSNRTSAPRDVRQSLPLRARRPAPHDMKNALAIFEQARVDGTMGDRGFTPAKVREAVRLAGTVGLDRTRSHPAGARLDAAFRALAVEHPAPWPMTCWAHHQDLLRAMVHVARARLALLLGQPAVARERLTAARSVLERLGSEETMIIWFRTTKAILALDEAERRLDDLTPKAA